MTTITNNVAEPKKVSPAITPNSAKTEKNSSTAIEETKPTQVKAEASKTNIDEILNPTAEQRISKLKIFNELAKKHETLKDLQEDFDIFRASYNGTNQKICLFGEKGYSFEIGNNETFAKVLNIVGDDLQKAIDKANSEVLMYQI